MTKQATSIAAVKRKAIGLIDSRQTDNDGLLIKRDRNITMLDIFGTEQRTAVAYYVSDLLAMGFNKHEILTKILERYKLSWKMRELNVVIELLHKMWRCDIAHTMNDQIAQQLAQIRTQKRVAWEAWEFSKTGNKHTKKHTSRQTSPAEEMTFDMEEVFEDSDRNAGDIKYLQLIADLCKEERKLLGLYAPEKKQSNVTGSGGNVNVIVVGADGSMAGTQINTQEQIENATSEEVKDPIAISDEQSSQEIEDMYKIMIEGV